MIGWKACDLAQSPKKGGGGLESIGICAVNRPILGASHAPPEGPTRRQVICDGGRARMGPVKHRESNVGWD